MTTAPKTARRTRCGRKRRARVVVPLRSHDTPPVVEAERERDEHEDRSFGAAEAVRRRPERVDRRQPSPRGDDRAEHHDDHALHRRPCDRRANEPRAGVAPPASIQARGRKPTEHHRREAAEPAARAEHVRDVRGDRAAAACATRAGMSGQRLAHAMSDEPIAATIQPANDLPAKRPTMRDDDPDGPTPRTCPIACRWTARHDAPRCAS